MKSQYATNDAIHDDLAGQAYVEQFGLETFTRADNAVRANKASRLTRLLNPAEHALIVSKGRQPRLSKQLLPFSN